MIAESFSQSDLIDQKEFFVQARIVLFLIFNDSVLGNV